MQIPAQPAAGADVVQLRRDVAPSQPAAPVASVSEQAQRLDSRVALRWAQPVLGADAGRLARDSATAHLGSAGAAAYSQLSMLASLLGPWMAKAEAQLAEGTPPAWPEPTADDGEASAAPHRSPMHQALDRLRSSLSRSEAFAASRLVQSWWLQPEEGLDDTAAQAQQAKWVSALSPGSEGAQQAARLLLTGQVQWEGLLLPDVPARIQRQDAWRGGEPDGRQPLEKGASLEITVNLPGLGPLRVLGRQWGQEVQLQVELPPGHEAPLRQRWDELQTRLNRLHQGGTQLQEAPSVKDAAAQAEPGADVG